MQICSVIFISWRLYLKVTLWTDSYLSFYLKVNKTKKKCSLLFYKEATECQLIGPEDVSVSENLLTCTKHRH